MQIANPAKKSLVRWRDMNETIFRKRTASDAMDMSEDLPLPGHRPPQPRPFHSNPSNDAGDPKFPDDGAEWLNNERGLPSEFEKVDGSHFLLAGANAHIELRSPYLRDFLDETPRNANPHIKAFVVVGGTSRCKSLGCMAVEPYLP